MLYQRTLKMPGRYCLEGLKIPHALAEKLQSETLSVQVFKLAVGVNNLPILRKKALPPGILIEGK